MLNFITHTLQSGLNRYLKLDLETATRLAILQGKLILLNFVDQRPRDYLAKPLNSSNKELLSSERVLGHMLITFNQDALELKLNFGPYDSDAISDVTILGTPLAFLSMLKSSDERAQLLREELAILGDLELAEKVMGLFSDLDIDWEEYLSHLTGDLVSHQFFNWFKEVRGAGQRITQTLRENIKEYIHEERPWFPPTEALNDWQAEVDTLRMDVDRLEARIAHLSQHLKKEG